MRHQYGSYGDCRDERCSFRWTVRLYPPELQQCDKVFQEKKSSSVGKLPRLEVYLAYVREGGTH